MEDIMRRTILRKAACILSLICMASLTACGGSSSSGGGTYNSVAHEAAPSAAGDKMKSGAPSAEEAPRAETEAAAAEAADGDAFGAAEAVEEAAPAPTMAIAHSDEAVDYEAEEEAYYGADYAGEDYAAGEVAPEAEAYDEEPVEEVKTASQIQAGQLTAGEWNDNENWGFFTNLCNAGRISFPAYGIDPRFRTAVTVKDKNGAPVVNATVTLFDEDTPSWTAVTDKQGVVYLFGKGDTLQVTSKDVTRLYRLTGEEEEPAPAETQAPQENEAETTRMTIHDAVEIVIRRSAVELLGQDATDRLLGRANEVKPEETPTMKQVEEDVRQSSSAFVSNEVEIEFDGSGESYKDMQIMFIVDTTGSMDDELVFLQSEFSAIAQTVGTDDVSYSVNFYKDNGDVYVTRTNPFSDDIRQISKKLNSEVANGGGDIPEAVSQILDECMHSQEWENDTVKLAFLIFDAPPHDDEHSLATLERAMKAASAQGIRVIPVVSSNSERETELFGRGLAIFTGGTYVFLTDDSGIGDSHLEPVIGAYEVESLYDLIIRLIEEYRQ